MEKIKSCPFCGKKPKGGTFDDQQVDLCCIDGDWYLNRERWNSAFCWRELSEKETEIKFQRKLHANAEAEVNQQAKRISELEGALKVISPVKFYALANWLDMIDLERGNTENQVQKDLRTIAEAVKEALGGTK